MNPSISTKNSVRAVWQTAQLSLISGGLALLAGCASEPASVVLSAPPPPAPSTQVVIAAQPQPVYQQQPVVQQQQNGTIIVTQAPPSLQQEYVSAQPSSDHKWIPGFWTWRNSRYEWMAGHWELPPSNGSVWVAPRWERTSNGGYRFFEGYWN